MLLILPTSHKDVLTWSLLHPAKTLLEATVEMLAAPDLARALVKSSPLCTSCPHGIHRKEPGSQFKSFLIPSSPPPALPTIYHYITY